MGQGWSEAFQRQVVSALIDGALGIRVDTLSSDLFTGPRTALVQRILDYHTEFGKFPSRTLLTDLVRKLEGGRTELRHEVRSILCLNGQGREFVVKETREVLKRRALSKAAIEIEELADADPESFSKAQTIVERALRTGEAEAAPFDFGTGLLDRHLHESRTRPAAPTGLSALDEALRGGLHIEELGLIFGPTKVGKSHIACAFGCQHLRVGGYVLHITLELLPTLTAGRYDRNLTGMSLLEIATQQDLFIKRHRQVVPDPQKLVIKGYPRFGATIHTISDDVKRTLDLWGQWGLIIVDYGSILRPLAPDRPDREIGRIHEGLSTLCVTQKVPIWSPYQTNRTALNDDVDGDLSMTHAGGSYESFQHADVLLAMCQGKDDKVFHEMTLKLLATRDCPQAQSRIRYDWGRSRIEEKREEQTVPRRKRRLRLHEDDQEAANAEGIPQAQG